MSNSSDRRAANAKLRKPAAPVARAKKDTDDAYAAKVMAAIYKRSCKPKKRGA